MDVTSHMFSLDERFPGIGPVGHPQLVLSYDQGMQMEEEKVAAPSYRISSPPSRMAFPLLLQ